jgi:hypothetical protein
MRCTGLEAGGTRARAARLIHGPELGDRVNAKALEEFLVHGIRYDFPPEKGGMTRGMPTASAAEPLSRKMTQKNRFQSGRSSKAPSGLCVFAALQESSTSGPEGRWTLPVARAGRCIARWECERARTGET